MSFYNHTPVCCGKLFQKTDLTESSHSSQYAEINAISAILYFLCVFIVVFLNQAGVRNQTTDKSYAN
jgi:hypothetical protein